MAEHLERQGSTVDRLHHLPCAPMCHGLGADSAVYSTSGLSRAVRHVWLLARMYRAHSRAAQRTCDMCEPTLSPKTGSCSPHAGGVGSLAGAALLAEVDLSNNRLTGALPALPAAIQMANMSGNAFAGGIPTSYGVLLIEHTQQHAPETCRATAYWTWMWLGCGCSSCPTACPG
jgi:hypothetical protein